MDSLQTTTPTCVKSVAPRTSPRTLSCCVSVSLCHTVLRGPSRISSSRTPYQPHSLPIQSSGAVPVPRCGWHQSTPSIMMFFVLWGAAIFTFAGCCDLGAWSDPNATVMGNGIVWALPKGRSASSRGTVGVVRFCDCHVGILVRRAGNERYIEPDSAPRRCRSRVSVPVCRTIFWLMFLACDHLKSNWHGKSTIGACENTWLYLYLKSWFSSLLSLRFSHVLILVLGNKGKAFDAVHFIGDHLWNSGNKKIAESCPASAEEALKLYCKNAKSFATCVLFFFALHQVLSLMHKDIGAKITYPLVAYKVLWSMYGRVSTLCNSYVDEQRFCTGRCNLVQLYPY